MSRLEGEQWLQSRQKRQFDKAFCMALAVPVSTLVTPAAGLVRTLDKVPPFFWQKRYGDILGEPFEIVKLRTMPGETRDTPSAGPRDPRASTLGTILRRTHIDELPQLVNIWHGEMSVVGPRPWTAPFVESLMDVLDDSERRAFVRARQVAKPGMVDPYSAFAYRKTDNNDLREMALGQIEYASSASFQKDLQIIASAAHVALEGALGVHHPKVAEAQAS